MDEIRELMCDVCSDLFTPMGKRVSKEQSENTPIVHPELNVSVNHFAKNTAFTDGRYRPTEETKKAYERAPNVSFTDLTG